MALTLNKNDLKDKRKWEKAEIELPYFDCDVMSTKTIESPTWVHFGAGNIFRGFLAVLQQELLNKGKVSTGIIAVEGYDYEIIDEIYIPYNNLSLLVTMNSNGKLDKKVVGSVGEALKGDPLFEGDWANLKNIFSKPSLQMVSLTITEKGYNLQNITGEYFKEVEEDMANGPDCPKHIISKIASLAYTRYKNGAYPIAFVSMDNCSHNGDKLHHSIKSIVQNWIKNDLVENEFLDYLDDPNKVAFPWTMIDKITPRPSESVKLELDKMNFQDNKIISTKNNTFIAPFVNAEGPEYLVIEDKFPNGRLPLELTGVYFTDRETVDKVEKMKVCTCLNPLHTALAIFGCLLEYKFIADEMKDKTLKKLVEKIGYEEGLPVVVDPGIFNPKDFLNEVIEERLPNPYIQDTPQRIATDTSQKLAVRFGETIKAYYNKEQNPAKLTYIPLVIAGWCRYLLGVSDSGEEMALSPDPMKEELMSYISEVKIGDQNSVGDSLRPILSNTAIFGIDLYNVGLGTKIENYFKEMISGKYAVKATLEKHLA